MHVHNPNVQSQGPIQKATYILIKCGFYWRVLLRHAMHTTMEGDLGGFLNGQLKDRHSDRWTVLYGKIGGKFYEAIAF